MRWHCVSAACSVNNKMVLRWKRVVSIFWATKRLDFQRGRPAADPWRVKTQITVVMVPGSLAASANRSIAHSIARPRINHWWRWVNTEPDSALATGIN